MPALVSNLEQIASANRTQTKNTEDHTQNVEDRQTVQERVQLPGEPTRGNGNTAGRAPGIHTDSNAAGITGSATRFIYRSVPQHVGNAACASPGSSFPPFSPIPQVGGVEVASGGLLYWGLPRATPSHGAILPTSIQIMPQANSGLHLAVKWVGPPLAHIHQS